MQLSRGELAHVSERECLGLRSIDQRWDGGLEQAFLIPLLFADARHYVFFYLLAGTWVAEFSLMLAMPGGPHLLEALVLALLGYPDQAQVRAREAIAVARRLDHPGSLAFTLALSCLTCLPLKQAELAETHSLELRELARERGMRFWDHGCAIFGGWAAKVHGAQADITDQYTVFSKSFILYRHIFSPKDLIFYYLNAYSRDRCSRHHY